MILSGITLPSCVPFLVARRDQSFFFSIDKMSFSIFLKRTSCADQRKAKRKRSMETILWEGKTYLKGPHRKDWTPYNLPSCALFLYMRNRCAECFLDCGRHAMGCIRTVDFAAKMKEKLPEELFVYWMIVEGCPQYHGQ